MIHDLSRLLAQLDCAVCMTFTSVFDRFYMSRPEFRVVNNQKPAYLLARRWLGNKVLVVPPGVGARHGLLSHGRTTVWTAALEEPTGHKKDVSQIPTTGFEPGHSAQAIIRLDPLS